ncbi:D-arabinono-1,4-lactone oxidase [Microbotryomycetes sp. JL221]|nr:D-arabinono-1,4-lactone oxidase [Microbotryomycetes sp. JL221]
MAAAAVQSSSTSSIGMTSTDVPTLSGYTLDDVTRLVSSIETRQLHSRWSRQRYEQPKFTNWATTFTCTPTNVFEPTTIQQVQAVVEFARRTGQTLRTSGSGHSPSDLVCTDGIVVNLDRMNKIIEVDSKACMYHVEAGMKLSALHPILREHGLAISSLGSISDQTVAGCLSTATHGSGVTFGNLSSRVKFLDMVLPLEGAPLVRVSREQDSDLFLSALCGLGTVGVIVGVGAECEPDFKLEEECWTISFKDFVERWQEIAESAEHVRCWWFPQIDQVKVSRLNRTAKAITPKPSRILSWVTETLIAKYFHAAVLTLSRLLPNILPYHAHVMYLLVHRPAPVQFLDLFRPTWPQLHASTLSAKASPFDALKNKIVKDKRLTKQELQSLPTAPLPTPPATPLDSEEEESNAETKVGSFDVNDLPLLTKPTYRVDLSNHVFNYDCGFPQYTYEGAVPYSETGSTLQDLERWFTTELYKSQGLRSHFPIEIRFTEEDDIWLSPTYKMRATYIGAVQYRPFNLPVPYKTLFKNFEAVLLSHQGRPHWAKSHTCSRTFLSQTYDKFEDFLKVRQRVDPQDVLVNEYVRRHLLGQVGEDLDMRRFKTSNRR